MTRSANENGLEIAIIGLAGRFPGASDIERFWVNLREAKSSIRFFTREELLAAGNDPTLIDHPQYVAARGVLEDSDLFDAAFFGFSPREAGLMDPRNRVFLECAWHALEHAAIDPATFPGPIGLYAGASPSSYLLRRFLARPAGAGSGGGPAAWIGNTPDFLVTRAAYKLDLKGPSIHVQTACSTSLVAVHLACRGLLTGECDLALAGGVSLRDPEITGNLYQEGMIHAPDGVCRPFDARARGTVDGSGVGLVVLKRLEEALRDGDTIHALVKASAINNDGSQKVGYTAPSEAGQYTVIAEALALAGVPAETISYVEAHGTGTPLGDPIEMAALAAAFGAETSQTGFCALGSVKAAIGHLDAAAGIAGLIKTVLMLRHRQIPPTLHFENPNPSIDFKASPFYVNSELSPWRPAGKKDGLLRAGVSSFGIGGTNAHLLLEEPPEVVPSEPVHENQVLLLSAKTATALDKINARLRDYLKANPELNLADVAHTLRTGRSTLAFRGMLVCRDMADAIAGLGDQARWRTAGGKEARRDEIPPHGRSLESLAESWLAGAVIDWRALDPDAPRRRLPLPLYPFERRSFRIETPAIIATRLKTLFAAAPENVRKPELADWCYEPSWRRRSIPRVKPAAPGTELWIFLQHEDSPNASMARRFRVAHEPVVTVTAAKSFTHPAADHFTLDPSSPEHYDQMIAQLPAPLPDSIQVVHGWCLTDEQISPQKSLVFGFFSMLFLAQSLLRARYPGKLLITALTRETQVVTGDEKPNPDQAVMLGPVRTLPQEIPRLGCRMVDMGARPEAEQDERLLDQLERELRNARPEPLVAWRGAWRWLPAFEPIYDETTPDPTVRKNGVYLITGGLGGIGRSLAAWLADQGPVRLALTSRSELPPADQWPGLMEEADTPCGLQEKVRALLALQQNGAQLLLLRADAGDADQMRSALERTLARFGDLDGVIHAAGLPAGSLIERKTRPEMEKILAPKIEGVRILASLLGDLKPDFVVLCSSLASELGGFGQAEYVAANAFMDSFAAAHDQTRGTRWISINWDTWSEVGMAVNTPAPERFRQLREARIERGIRPEEGKVLFARILGRPAPRVLVSTTDLPARFRRNRVFGNFDRHEPLASQPASVPLQPRPDLNQEYVAPRNERESALAQIWQDLLGIERVGIEDDLYDLGGDSLLSTQILSRVNDAFQANLPAFDWFDKATVAQQAELLETVLWLGDAPGPGETDGEREDVEF